MEHNGPQSETTHCEPESVAAGNELLARMAHEPVASLVPLALDLAHRWADDERIVVIAATVLRKSGDAAHSLKLLLTLRERQPDSAIIDANIAAAYEHEGDFVKACEYYWQATQLAPNFLPAVAGYSQCSRKLAGEDGYWNAIQQLSALPGAWVAPLLIVREDIRHGRKKTVVRSCKRLLAMVGDDPEPIEAIVKELDTGNCHEELNSLIPIIHLHRCSLQTYQILVTAAVRCKDLKAAQNIINSAPANHRHQLSEMLSLASLATSSPISLANQTTMSLMVIDSTPWYELLGSPEWLYPTTEDEANLVAFAPIAAPASAAGVVNTGPLGAYIRSLPFILSESLHNLGVTRSAALLLLADRNIPAVPGNEVPMNELYNMLRSANIVPKVAVSAALSNSSQHMRFSYHIYRLHHSELVEADQKSFEIADLRSAITVMADMRQDICTALNFQPKEPIVGPVGVPTAPAVIACSEHMLRALIALRTAEGSVINQGHLSLRELFGTLNEQDNSLFWQVQRAAAVVAATTLRVSAAEDLVAECARRLQQLEPSNFSAFTIGLAARRALGGDATLTTDIKRVRASADQRTLNWMTRISLV